ncbi:MAG TPA: phosphate ABC transporter permease subunit PstC [Cellvibrionales bacterium]|nr:phosphate ABC transporter permease subunit PstC [Pseudomonadales bacterium]HAB56116.1 phosphate ABC transporter permease subunit PstC [Cellvibrionales bacterium]HCX27005.1 phosphate ABC transporter permease subunit PstC [Cellvibrionales bacterium]
MPFNTLFTIFVVVIAFCFFAGQRRALKLKSDGSSLHSLPFYHGTWLIIVGVLPALIILLVWSLVESSIIRAVILSELPANLMLVSAAEKSLLFSEVANLANGQSLSPNAEQLAPLANRYTLLESLSGKLKLGLALIISVIGFGLGWLRLKPDFRARNRFESTVRIILMSCASLAVLTTVGIVFSVLFEAMRFFDTVSIFEFIFGTHWSPQIAIREGQVGSSGAFGAVPLFVGTMLISTVAMIVAVPIGLMSAIYLSEYASPKFRAFAKPLLEVLAGVPTVVYGFFAAITVAPMLRDFGEALGLSVSSESALAAGLVMGVMIIPFVSSLSDDVINAVPQSLRDGSFGLGATQSETIRRVIIPAALPGIVGAILLAVSRAIGETMIVVMAAGLSANLTINPLETVTTVTVQIVTLLVGDQEFDSPKTLAAFALGLMLFVTTLCLNVVALYVVRRYREQYD